MKNDAVMIAKRLLHKQKERIRIGWKASRLKNHRFTLLSNNCIAGIIYHDVGEQFCSPTINLLIKNQDFLTFIENLEDCLTQEIHEVASGEAYPVGCIELPGSKIYIHFMHYKSFREAVDKWESRKKRINKDNLFVLMEMGPDTREETVQRFLRLPFSNKMAFVNVDTDNANLFNPGIYGDDYHAGKILEFDKKKLKMQRYLDRFNYVKWLNSGIVNR